jgi:hypothetical protein
MAVNPLQQYFRQPKIYIDLPSHGAYSKPGSIQGDSTNIPVYGMTGMDEVIMRTPDALFTGESTVKIVESCVPNIKDAWDLSIIDTDMLFSAIRIATFGNLMTVGHKCPSCDEEHDHDLDLNFLIEHYRKCNYDAKIVLQDLVITVKPLSYRESTSFNIKNYELQKKLAQTEEVEDKVEQQKLINEMFVELSKIQQELYYMSVEAVETPQTRVTERSYITEWLNNCDKNVFDSIRDQIEKNKKAWTVPSYKVTCSNCKAENELTIELDQSNFFV